MSNVTCHTSHVTRHTSHSIHTLELIVEPQDNGASAADHAGSGSDLLWGCVPSALMGDLNDGSDWRLRAAAIEHLLRIFEGLADHHAANGCLQQQQQTLLLPSHTSSFLDLLLKLLRDANFKVELTAMQVNRTRVVGHVTLV
jgi:hypothetical protein